LCGGLKGKIAGKKSRETCIGRGEVSKKKPGKKLKKKRGG